MEMRGNPPNEPRRVLVFPYGSEISNEIVRALKHNKHFPLVLATSDESLLSLREGAGVDYLPHVSAEEFGAAMCKLIIDRSISFVIPAHDDVALLLSTMELPDGCRVIGQNSNINRIVRYKSKTYDALRDVVPVPRTFRDLGTVEFPVFVKPDRGQGSRDAVLINSLAELEEFIKDRDANSFVYSEYLPGEEFTVDCFSHDGALLFAGPRTRERTINGISALSRTVESDERLEESKTMGSKISAHLGMHGLWFFQAKADVNGELRLLEVGPRVSGTMMVNRARGVNFVELALWQALGKPVQLEARGGPVVVRRTLEPHFEFDNDFERLLVDFDDTLMIGGGLNVSLMALIFSAKNMSKPVILITKHQGGRLIESLRKFGIYAVFDEIVHLKPEDQKSNYLSRGDLLIDDSFAERSAFVASGGHAASLDMIEMYLPR